MKLIPAKRFLPSSQLGFVSGELVFLGPCAGLDARVLEDPTQTTTTPTCRAAFYRRATGSTSLSFHFIMGDLCLTVSTNCDHSLPGEF